MPFKPTLFVVTDIETTMKKRIAFDVAWKTIDKRGNEYGRGSYVIREAFRHDVPFFAHKLGPYRDWETQVHQVLEIRLAELHHDV